MKKFVLLMLALAIAAPAWAGSGAKCNADAQSCLNHWAAKKSMGWAGLEYDKSGGDVVVVKSTTANSPAANAGLEAGDVLVAMNGVKMSDKEALKKAKGDWTPGQKVTYTIKRKDAEKQIALVLAPMPEQVFASMVGSHMLENHVAVARAEAKTGDKK